MRDGGNGEAGPDRGRLTNQIPCRAMATSPIFIVIGLKFAVVSMSLVSNDPAWMWRK
jgi:hypothetical protein